MSIIQDALKKAEAQVKGPSAPRSFPQSDGKAHSPAVDKEAARSAPRPRRHDPVAVTVLLAVLVITAAFAARELFPGKGISGQDQKETSAKVPEGIPAKAAEAAAVKPAASEDFPTLQSIVFQRPEEIKDYRGEFVLNGIMYLEDSPRAIINDSMVGIGDTISGAKVLRIEKRHAVLQYNDAEIVLDLK